MSSHQIITQGKASPMKKNLFLIEIDLFLNFLIKNTFSWWNGIKLGDFKLICWRNKFEISNKSLVVDHIFGNC